MNFGSKANVWQFSLRSAFVALTLVPLALYALVRPFRIREEILLRLRTVGAPVTFDYEWTANGSYREGASPPGNAWVKSILGEHYASHPRDVLIGEASFPERIDDNDAALLASLSRIKWLSLQGTHVTDHGLMKLTTLGDLERLDLEGSRATPDGIRRFKAILPNVRVSSDYPEVDNEHNRVRRSNQLVEPASEVGPGHDLDCLVPASATSVLLPSSARQ